MNDKVVKKSNTSVSKSSNIDSDSFIENLKRAETIAEYVVNSDTFGSSFEKQVLKVDKEGVPILDKDGKEQYVKVKNKNDVITTILVGSELGISPMTAVTLGNKKLNAKGFTKVMRGKALGIDPVTALDVIDVIPSGNGDVISVGVHIISKVLLENNVKIEVLEDFKPIDIYYYAGSNNEADISNLDYYIVTKFSTKEDLAKAKNEGKTLVTRKTTYRTTIKLIRGEQVIERSYTLQQATDAGLYKGVATDGTQVDGKANWNNHPAIMLFNRPLTIAGRIIVADKIMNTYDKSEVEEFTDYEYVPDDEDLNIKQELTDDDKTDNSISTQE